MKLALLSLLAVVLAQSAPPAAAGALHVATDGNDAWSGLLARPNAGRTDGPLATLAGARDATRRLPREEEKHIVIQEGQYSLTEPLVLEAQDGGVTYEAAEGAHPLISGGRRIVGFHPVAGGLWQPISPKCGRGSGTLKISGSTAPAPHALARRMKSGSRRLPPPPSRSPA